MLKITDLRAQDFDPAAVVPRALMDVSEALDIVQPILNQVKDNGEAALLDLAEKFDGVRPASLRVPAEVIASALKNLDPAIRSALTEAIRRARIVHAAQLPADSTVELAVGAEVVNRWVPVDRVGLYVPGGKAVYPSSVVMNVVPAQAAGVPSLAIASPPQADNDGWPHPTILAAAALLGVDEVYAAGGAQAIAMFAYGAKNAEGETVCAKADLVTGPGNIYVAAAKRALRGVIGIDAEAGPTEIAVLADASANPEFVAADMISQAEHDPMAASVLVTTSMEFAEAVNTAITAQAGNAEHRKRINEALTGEQSGILVVEDLDTAIELVDEYAAEHLQIMTADARTVAERIRNAGAIFVGDYSPVPLGDYSSGSNHVLPTSGTAKFSSGLNVTSFLRSQQLIHYSESALGSIAHNIEALAVNEGLPAHGEAIKLRFEN
ncbi:histidinol dehydrogenase [Micrococcoides hystricis]|uniref:Histidinol dehydrogenase n=1 Tax=Micrococcoides hystricis TaxID=1572761 RepID=A0ABV6PCS1_9MICC